MEGRPVLTQANTFCCILAAHNTLRTRAQRKMALARRLIYGLRQARGGGVRFGHVQRDTPYADFWPVRVPLYIPPCTLHVRAPKPDQ